MVLALGVAGDLGADDALRVGLPLGAAHPADMRGVDALDRQRAGARAIVRADAVGDVERHCACAETWPENRVELTISARSLARSNPSAQRVEPAGLAQRLGERDRPGDGDVQRARAVPASVSAPAHRRSDERIRERRRFHGRAAACRRRRRRNDAAPRCRASSTAPDGSRGRVGPETQPTNSWRHIVARAA